MLIEKQLEIYSSKPVHVSKGSYLIEIPTDCFLLLHNFTESLSYNNFLIECTSDNEIVEPETILLCFVMDTLICFFRTAYCYCPIAFSHNITLLDNIRRFAVKGFGFSRPEGAGGKPCAMLALQKETLNRPTFPA